MHSMFARAHALGLFPLLLILLSGPALAQAETQLTGGGTDQRPAWSPDGSTVLFDSNRNGNLDLWSIPSAGGVLTQITLSAEDERDGDWSPDGGTIVYSADVGGGGGFDLFLRSVSGGAATPLVTDPADPDVFPAWSPDSTQIAFSKGNDIWIVPAGGGAPTQITNDPGKDTHPTWSLDGLTIAFQSDRSGNDDIWTIPASGGIATQLTNDPGIDGSPDWSPDGTQIAFQSDRGGNNDLWVIPVGGGTPVQITTDPGSDVQPDWSPLGDQIAFARDGGIWTTAPGADLAVAKTVDMPIAAEADTVVYTVEISNAGPGATTGVEVTDVLPAGVSYLAHTTTQGTYVPGSGLWTVGTLLVAGADTLTITVSVDAGTSGMSITNTASVTASDQTDPNAANDAGSVGVTVSNVIASTETQITANGTDNRPAWSRDGTTIAFDSNRSGNRDVFTVPAAGGSVAQLTFGSSTDRDPDWNSDGTLLVFAANPGGGNADLFIKPVAGGAATVLDSDPLNVDGFPSWSPDSTQIAYRKGNDIYVIPAAGGAPAQLTTDPAIDSHPSWSPDGAQIVFQSDRSGNEDVWSIPAAGGTPVQLTTDPAHDGSPDWSPDGSRITFQSNRGGTFDIWIISDTGGGLTQVTTDPSVEVSPDWSPDGSGIVFARAQSGIWIAALPKIDIAVGKSVNDSSPDEGQAVTYTVNATNLGPDGATGVGVTDLLPAGVTYQSHAATQGTYNAGTGFWSIGAMASGAVSTLTLVGTVDAGTAGQTITNVAAYTNSIEKDTSTANDTASVGVIVTAVDLAVAKSVDAPTPNVGDTVTYTVTVSNAGPDDATGVAVTDLLPAGVTYVSDAPSQGTYDAGTGAWIVGAVPAGTADTLTISATVDASAAGTTATNTATRTASDQADTNGGNDSASAAVTVPAIDLAVTKQVDDATPDEGDQITYTVTVANVGATAAGGVAVTDLLPSGLAFVSGAVTQGAYDNGTGMWTVGSVPAGATDTLTIVAAVNAGTLGSTLVNTAARTASDEADTSAANDLAQAVVMVSTTVPATETELTTPGTEDQRPAWSPDGTTILFDSRRSGNLDLWSIPATGGTPVQITLSTQVDRHPDWSPDGLSMVYASDPGGSGFPDLYTRLASGGGATLVDSDPASVDGFPSWSPDGTQIAYRKGTDLFLIPAGGGTPVRLTTDPATDSHPTWSPDGTQIAFQSDRGGNNDIWVIPAGGGAASQLTTDPGADGAPDWSPDGTRIAFHSDRSGSNDLWVIGPSGGIPAQVTADSLDDVQPDWSPDGTAIVFSRNEALWIAQLPVADIGLAKTVDNAAPNEGAAVTYTIVVTNAGPDAGTGIVVGDPLPAGVTFQSAAVTRGSYDSGTGSWSLGSLAVAAADSLVITATVDLGTNGSTITNTASVSAVVQQDTTAGNDSASVAITVTGGAVDAPSLPAGPAAFAFAPAQPNPFRGRTSFRFDVPVAGFVDLSVYDVSGRLVRALVRERVQPGTYRSVWDGRDGAGTRVAPGVYFVKFQSETFRTTRKAVRLD